MRSNTKRFVRLMLVWLVCGIASGVQAQVSIPVQFDNTPDETLTPPFVGAGTFTFTTDPGNGVFALSSLGTPQFAFTFGATTFTGADIQTPLNEIQAVLSGQGAGRTVLFSNTNPFGSGPLGGSIDFVQGNGDDLSFEPPGYSSSLIHYFADVGSEAFAGNYANAASVPEPGFVGLLLTVGLSGTGLLLRRRNGCG